MAWDVRALWPSPIHYAEKNTTGTSFELNASWNNALRRLHFTNVGAAWITPPQKRELWSNTCDQGYEVRLIPESFFIPKVRLGMGLHVTLSNLLGSELNRSYSQRNRNEIVLKWARLYIRTSSIGITSINFSSGLSSISLDEETQLITLWSFVGIEAAEVTCVVFSIYIKWKLFPTFTSSK